METSDTSTKVARLPPPVRPGARVGVAALSGPVAPEPLEAGLAGLRSLGFEPVAAANLDLESGLFAGFAAERLEGFHRFAADEDIEAIFFARGGHGTLRVLPDIDWQLLARRPRAYIGYSDLTPLLNQLVTRLGLVAFHGPMVGVEMARGLEGVEVESLVSALAGELPATVPVEVRGHSNEDSVEGRLIGGCLSLITATLDTEYALPFDDSILFWEDVDEPLYRIDRMLTHPGLSGSLPRINGMLAGRVELTETIGGVSHGEDPLSELLEELSLRYGWPVASGCASGHCQPNLTLPLGCRALIEPGKSRVVIEAPAEAHRL